MASSSSGGPRTRGDSGGGMEGIKTLVQISIADVTLQGICSSSETKSSFSCCFQRSLKSVSSREHVVEHGQDDVTVGFAHETLSLVVTLVRDPATGLFQKKQGKLVIRRQRTGRLFGTGFQGLAVALLPLHELLADYTMRKLALPLVDCNGVAGGVINVTINPKFISEVRGSP